MSSSNSAKVTFRVPRTLTWDKLVALYLAVRALIGQHSFNFDDFEGVVHIQFDDEDVTSNFVDVDCEEPYNQQPGMTSATQIMVGRYNLQNLFGVQRLINLLGKNNQTGNLKSDKGSLVALIRQLYAVGGANPSRERRLNVIRLLWPVVEAFFVAGENASNHSVITSMQNPFTVDSACALFGLCGEQSDDFRAAMDAARTNIEKLEKVAEDRASELTDSADRFSVDNFFKRPMPEAGMWIETDNARVAKHVFNQNPIVVLITRAPSRGNVCIQTRGTQMVERLVKALNDQDPNGDNVWYAHAPIGGNQSAMVANGSTSRQTRRTGLTKVKIIAILQKNYRHRNREQQQKLHEELEQEAAATPKAKKQVPAKPQAKKVVDAKFMAKLRDKGAVTSFSDLVGLLTDDAAKE